jgi:hypothetical protein
MAIHHALSFETQTSDLELLVELICNKITFQDTIMGNLRFRIHTHTHIYIYKAIKRRWIYLLNAYKWASIRSALISIYVKNKLEKINTIIKRIEDKWEHAKFFCLIFYTCMIYSFISKKNVILYKIEQFSYFEQKHNNNLPTLDRQKKNFINNILLWAG